MKTSKSKVGEKICEHDICLEKGGWKSATDGKDYCRYHWWGVHKMNKEPVYIYKDLQAAQNQASRDKSWIVSPFYVIEQTPETQETLKIEGHEFKWSTITIVIVGAFLLGCFIRLLE